MLVGEVIRWQYTSYRMLEKILYREFECRRSKVAGCFGSDCKVVKLIEYHICRTWWVDGNELLFAVKFYIKEGIPVVGLSHHIVYNGHRFYPAIDWDREIPPPRRLLDKAVFWWIYKSYSKKITAYHIVLPHVSDINTAIKKMKCYTDSAHWAVTVRRMKQGIFEDFAILRVMGLQEEVINYYYYPADPMAWLNKTLRQLFWL